MSKTTSGLRVCPMQALVLTIDTTSSACSQVLILHHSVWRFSNRLRH